jgi:hypothetical protein
MVSVSMLQPAQVAVRVSADEVERFSATAAKATTAARVATVANMEMAVAAASDWLVKMESLAAPAARVETAARVATVAPGVQFLAMVAPGAPEGLAGMVESA